MAESDRKCKAGLFAEPQSGSPTIATVLPVVGCDWKANNKHIEILINIHGFAGLNEYRISNFEFRISNGGVWQYENILVTVGF